MVILCHQQTTWTKEVHDFPDILLYNQTLVYGTLLKQHLVCLGICMLYISHVKQLDIS